MSELDDRAMHRRAVEAVIWGMPAVNYRLMHQAAVAVGGTGDNRIVHWTGLADWRNQTLTPNPDVIYLMPFFDTTDGPVVLEVPPADGGTLNGSIMNLWQTAIEDIGPAGLDEGRGGKCLILPRGHDGTVPEGYIPLRSDTYRGYGLIRAVLRDGSEADIADAVAYAGRLALYPLAEAHDPPPTVWVDATGTLFDGAIPYDLRFYRALDDVVQAEPWLPRDRVMIDQLRTVGIERGTPFDPDPASRTVLTSAIDEARAWLDEQYVKAMVPFNEGAHWALPAQPELITATEAFFDLPDIYPVDARGVVYSFAYFSSKHLGKGQFYLVTIADADGRPLDGGAAYRLTVPAHVPVTQYWSATVYDRETHTLVREVSRPGRSSQSSELIVNGDGTTDLHFGPHPPPDREPNWTPTDPDGSFEIMFRFYGPTAPLFDKTWRLPDIESIGPG